MHLQYLLYAVLSLLCIGLSGNPTLATDKLDSSFGYDGRIAVDLGVYGDRANAVLVQPDGKILVAGSSSTAADLDFMLLRFNADGTMDSTFNFDGTVTTPVGSYDDEAFALELLSDGRVVVAGYASNGRDRDLALVCYNEDGSLDRNFGTEGMVMTAVGNRHEEITALAVNQQDQILVAGVAEGTTGRIIVVGRYLPDGYLDASFGEDGLSLVGVGDDTVVEGIALTKVGGVVVSGTYQEGTTTSMMLAGFTEGGLVDEAFGVQGVAIPTTEEEVSEGFGLAVHMDGSFAVAGSVGLAGERDAALFHFTDQGEPLKAFGEEGVIVTRVSPEDDVLFDVVIGADKVVASGYTTKDGIRDFLLISYAREIDAPEAASFSEIDETVELQEKDVPLTGSGVQKTGTSGKPVQVGGLQIGSSLDDYLAEPDPSLPSVQGRSASSSGSSIFKRVMGQVANFILPGAIAAEVGSESAGDTPVADNQDQEGRDEGKVVATVVTTSFGEGDAEGAAIAVQPDGNVVIVGTAKESESSTAAVARYETAQAETDATVDKVGYENSLIRTKQAFDVTGVSAISGGEIMPDFDNGSNGAVTQRGVAYSIAPDPVYKEITEPDPDPDPDPDSGTVNGSSQPTTSILLEKSMNGVANFLVSNAYAANDNPGSLGLFNKSAADAYVLEGVTEDGSGTGAYSSMMKQLKPSTTYWVRAYALTESGSVYYGNQLSFRTSDACFIATASFGTLLHPSVRLLRDFRDKHLTGTLFGDSFIDFYYTYSPPVADMISKNSWARFAVRLLLLPAIGFSWLSLQIGLAASSLLVTLLLIGVGYTRVRLVRN